MCYTWMAHGSVHGSQLRVIWDSGTLHLCTCGGIHTAGTIHTLPIMSCTANVPYFSIFKLVHSYDGLKSCNQVLVVLKILEPFLKSNTLPWRLAGRNCTLLQRCHAGAMLLHCRNKLLCTRRPSISSDVIEQFMSWQTLYCTNQRPQRKPVVPCSVEGRQTVRIPCKSVS